MSVKYVCNETQFKITNLFFLCSGKKLFLGIETILFHFVIKFFFF